MKTNDEIDDIFKAMVHTTVASAPAAPTIDAIAEGVPPTGVVRLDARHGSRRWMAIAAAVVLIVAGLVWITAIRHPSTTPTDGVEPDRVAPYLLPTSIPDGWRLVAMSERSFPPRTAFGSEQLVVSADGTQRALLLTVPATALPEGAVRTVATAADGTWSAADSNLTGYAALSWGTTDQLYSLTAVGMNEAQVRALGASLIMTTTPEHLSLPPGSGFTATDVDVTLGGRTVDTEHLMFVGGAGRSISLIVSDPSDPLPQTLLEPQIPAEQVHVGTVEGLSEARVVVSGETVTATASQQQAVPTAGIEQPPVDPALLTQLVSGLTTVSPAAWQQQAARISDQLAELPVIATSLTRYGTLTLRADDSTSAICIQQNPSTSSTSCGWSESSTAPATADIILADRWFEVALVADGVGVKHSSIAHVSVELGNQRSIIFTPPIPRVTTTSSRGITSFTYTLDDGSPTATAIRPLRPPPEG